MSAVRIERRILYGTRLDELFERWEATYTPEQRAGFHRDGAIDEAIYYAEPKRVLFVQVEPNSTGGRFSRFYGHDLRLVFPQLLEKDNTVHMAMFTSIALEGKIPRERLAPAAVHGFLRRFACINLKKLSGTSVSEESDVAPYAWRDRALCREQVRLLEPHMILAGGPIVASLLGKVLFDRESWKPRDDLWQWRGVPVISTYHPSVRRYLLERGMTRLAALLGIPPSA